MPVYNSTGLCFLLHLPFGFLPSWFLTSTSIVQSKNSTGSHHSCVGLIPLSYRVHTFGKKKISIRVPEPLRSLVTTPFISNHANHLVEAVISHHLAMSSNKSDVDISNTSNAADNSSLKSTSTANSTTRLLGSIFREDRSSPPSHSSSSSSSSSSSLIPKEANHAEAAAVYLSLR